MGFRMGCGLMVWFWFCDTPWFLGRIMDMDNGCFVLLVGVRAPSNIHAFYSNRDQHRSGTRSKPASYLNAKLWWAKL